MTSQEQEQAPSFELPPARRPEQVQEALQEQQNMGIETRSSVANEHGMPQASSPAVSTQQAQQQADSQSTIGVNGTMPVPQNSGDIVNSPSPHIADDADLIEKEWVEIAKSIVARTAHDPHVQNKEMTRFKADYMKKRYNKDIKLGEGA